jgi:hypothetical protein
MRPEISASVTRFIGFATAAVQVGTLTSTGQAIQMAVSTTSSAMDPSKIRRIRASAS